jgi:hypothetical protein
MTDLIAVQKIAGWEKLKTLVLDSVSSPNGVALDSAFFKKYRDEDHRLRATVSHHGSSPGRSMKPSCELRISNPARRSSASTKERSTS